MKYYGVVYDVGLRFSPDTLSVEPFNPSLVEYDINTIANDLNANAIRVEGEEISRLVTSAHIAHKVGLTVFFNPWKMGATVEETQTYLAEAAKEAERLRLSGVKIVFVVGCELTIFSDGIFPGNSWAERGMWLSSQSGNLNSGPGGSNTLAEKTVLLNQALRSFVETVRPVFGGQITYSAGLWEDVDWSIFDIVGVDYYRHTETDEEYVAGLNRYRREGIPITVMEVGCCAYEGAGKLGDGGFAVLQGVNQDGTGIFQEGVVPKRSEWEQADYIGTQLELLNGADVEAVFVFEFSKPVLPFGEGTKDHDLASFALVKTFAPDDPRSQSLPPWEPKEAFHRVAQTFRKFSESRR
ncbi:hypothetical protein [Priestia megaterium]|uniref:hypothetical protein n=1 Tax=Priestia megaterium TaxID=1404 RepID=UPI002040FCAB|nr:hypothetical protein [Priestia megaterium]MCM3186386.1 hypothetical protein [Priestia megaterium]